MSSDASHTDQSTRESQFWHRVLDTARDRGLLPQNYCELALWSWEADPGQTPLTYLARWRLVGADVIAQLERIKRDLAADTVGIVSQQLRAFPNSTDGPARGAPNHALDVACSLYTRGRTKVGPYVLRRFLSAGGMGAVFLAEHHDLGHVVALKVLQHDALRDPVARGRFLREMDSLRMIEHSNIAGVELVSDGDGPEGFPYLAMEYVRGSTLQQLIADPISIPSRWVEIIAAAARGVEAVHAHGILHRDIKPDNILVTDSGRVVLVDFGLARQRDGSHLTSHGLIAGTLDYLAPELIDGHDPAEAVDQYALGATLYHSLHGYPPYMADSVAQQMRLILAAQAPSPTPDRELGTLVLRAMAESPEDRFESVAAFREALNGWLDADAQRP